jgi:hypothetical protein
MKEVAGSGAFGRILETLIAREERDDTDTTHRATGRSMPFWNMAGQKSRKRSRGAAKPSDFLDILHNGQVAEAETETMPEIRAEDIRTELGITDTHDLADLARIRKSFAAANHPDRNSGDRRQWAEERMKHANSIIDAEIARRRTAGQRRFRT